jgi:hypothetical protein
VKADKMTNLDVEEALFDCSLAKTFWEWGPLDNEEVALEAALDAFDERLMDATVPRRNAFERALTFVLRIDNVHKSVEAPNLRADTPSAMHTEIRRRSSRLFQLTQVLNSALGRGYFDTSRLLLKDLGTLPQRYGYNCTCRCAGCERSHGTACRVFLWPALLQQHLAVCINAQNRSATAPIPTLDGAEELADIIAGAMHDQ